MSSDGKSSHYLWQGELKMLTENYQFLFSEKTGVWFMQVKFTKKKFQYGHKFEKQN
jgi:hypothetical protein